MSTSSKKKSIPQKNVKIVKITQLSSLQSRAFPLALLADGILLLIFLMNDTWVLKPDKYFYFAIGTAVVFILTLLKRNNRNILLGKISVIFIVLFAQCVLYFIGLFYGLYPKFALQQFYLNIGSLFVFATAYICFMRNEQNIEKYTNIFSIVIGIASLVSIELATSGYLAGLCGAIAGLFNTHLPNGYGAFETNTRIVTVLGNPNVFAPITVIGMFFALYNSGNAWDNSRKGLINMCIAIICGATFILCFSLGTILTYIVMLAVYIIVTPQGSRRAKIIPHIFCIVISVIAASIVFALRSLSILPLISMIVLSLAAAYLFPRIKQVKIPAFKGKLSKAPLISGITLCIIFAMCASLMHSSYNLNQGGSFKRAAALKAGTYSFEVKSDMTQTASSVTIDIESMSYAEAALKEKTLLTSKTLQTGEKLEFTVPESSAAVFFNIMADNPLRITDITISGASSATELPLKYTLIPEFIINRLQGLWVSDNAIQRFIFFRDGIRLGIKSPVIGLGGGAFEGGLNSVADYYYQTKHAHNELIQRFVDGGILGVLLFLLLAWAVFRALYRARQSEKVKPLLPLLTGCAVVIFIHSLIEVDFFIPAYRITAYLLFALAAAQCQDFIVLGKKAGNTLTVLFAAVCLSTFLVMIGQYSAHKMFDENATLQTLVLAARIDPFNRDDYRLTYLNSTRGSTDPAIASVQNSYLYSMKNDVVGNEARAQFYFQETHPDVKKGTESAEKYIHENRVNPAAWDTILSYYNTALDSMSGDSGKTAIIADSIKSLCDYLSELNKTLPKKIEPTLAAYSYIRASCLTESSKTGIIVTDSRIICDLNQDGEPDIINNTAGETQQWKLEAALSGTYLIKLYQKATASSEITLDSGALECTYSAEEGCFIASVSKTPKPVSELIIKTDQLTQNVYFTIEKTS